MVDASGKLAALTVPVEMLGSLRETLCLAQSQLARNEEQIGRGMSAQVGHLQHLLNEVERHRPTGPNGKHGRLHTPTCGCEDVFNDPDDFDAVQRFLDD